MDCKKVATNIRAELKKYIQENGLKSLVIGVSGGVDSATCCALARPVCDELGISLIGRSLPTNSNKPDERLRASQTGILCTDFKEIDLEQVCLGLNDFVLQIEGKHKDDFRDKMRFGNVKARSRMIYLYNLAFLHDGLVLSTDNLTEMYEGYFTLHGDHADYGMIQNLWKTEVYELAEYLKEELEKSGQLDGAKVMGDSIKAAPTDGLGITDTDLDQLKAATYADVDRILKIWLCFDKVMFEDSTGMFWYPGRPKNHEDFEKLHRAFSTHPVIERYERTHFKRNWPINIDREKLFQGV